MRRILGITIVLAAAAALVVAGTGAGDEAGKRYTLELDSAFGLVKGADLKIAGTRAGKIVDIELDRGPEKYALVEVEVTKTGFDSIREDVTCETRPQSLIGEYFIDCDPGKGRELADGARIKNDKTVTTIPADLVNNILRRPYRERFRIILNELGAGVGGRAEDLNTAIRKAVPALRETNKVLAILGSQNQILGDLVEDADVVLGDLADNRRDIRRWVREAGETATASAERRTDISAGLNKLPAFLTELESTMVELGRVAEEQAPALTSLRSAAPELTELLTDLEPFSESTQVNLRSLGQAARQGLPAVRAAGPVVDQLEQFTPKVPELANNLDIVLGHLDDRSFAVNKDPRSPGGQGYTGLEAILQYVYDQAAAINVYDANGYVLKANLSETECSSFQTGETAKAKGMDFIKRCGSYTGPNQQGVFQDDPTAGFQPTGAQASRAKKKRTGTKKRGRAEDRDEQTPFSPLQQEDRLTPPSGKPGEPPVDLDKTLDDLLGPVGRRPKVPDVPAAPAAPQPGSGVDSNDALLDFLFGS